MSSVCRTVSSESRARTRSTLPSKISGEALTTHRLLMLDFFDQLLIGHLAGWHFPPEQLLEELRADLSPRRADQRARSGRAGEAWSELLMDRRHLAAPGLASGVSSKR